MKRNSLFPLILFLVSFAQALPAQTPPIRVSGVVNAASFAPSAPLAPGVIFSVFGSGLTDGSTAGAAILPLPTRLAGARLLVNGIAAPLFFASPNQINAQLPVELTGMTSATLQVEVQSAAGTVTSTALVVAVAPFSPGIFTQDQNGSGPGSVFRASDFSKICPPGRFDCQANPVAPGESVTIFMTGLGAVNGTWAGGLPAQSALPTTTIPVVTIGGVQAQVLFAGLATRFVGLYQVNVTVPPDVLPGAAVALILSIGGATSNPVTIAVGTPSTPPLLGGPPGPAAAVSAIVIDPLNQSTLYASTQAGVFKSTNGGESWAAANAGLKTLPTRLLAIDPARSGTVYAMTDSGIFKSTDGAVNWSATNVPTITDSSGRTQFPGILALIVDRLSNVYAATGSGVYKSVDGAASWIAVNDGLPRVGPPPADPSLPTFPGPIQAVIVDPVSPATLYAVTASGPNNAVFKSTDGARSWTAVNRGLTATDSLGRTFTPGVQVLAIAASNPATLYAGTPNNGVFKSTDGGASWAEVNNGLTSTQNGRTFFASVTALAVDPQNPAIVYAGILGGVTKTNDGGASWNATSNGLPPETLVRALAIDPSNPATVFTATFFGLFKTTDRAASWRAANSGIAKTSSTEVHALAIDPSAPSTLYAGTSPGTVFRSSNAGASWTAADRGLIGFASALVIDPSNPTIVYAGIGGAGSNTSVANRDGVYKSTDSGTNWTRASNGLRDQMTGVRRLLIDPSNPAVLYVVTGGGFFKSTNGAASWTALDNSSFSNGLPAALAIDPSNSAILYAGTSTGVLKSTDGGGSWSPANDGLGSLKGTYISAVVIDPKNPATLYVSGALAGAVFKSTNSGATWAPANSGLPAATVQTLAIDPANPATLYAATGSGVFKTTNGGMNWTGANSGLFNSVSVLVISSSTTPTTVYAGTNSSGVFKSADGGASWQPTGSTLD